MNLFELPAIIDKVKETLDTTMKDVDAAYLLKAGSASIAKFVLSQAKAEGPPASFAERLHMDPDQAKVLYNAVLEAALSRK